MGSNFQAIAGHMGALTPVWRRQAALIVRKADALRDCPDDELFRKANEIRWQVRSGTALQRVLNDAYALVVETASRAIGLRHYPVQVVGGIALFNGFVAEMQTGEGKTLTATLPAFLRALPGKGVHVITTNDYLAHRDAEIMGPIYQRLGMTVGCVQTSSTPEERRAAYDCDITYGTSKEFGFDFLRDRLEIGTDAYGFADDPQHSGIAAVRKGVQRGHYFGLIDEADSVLIDDAVTPLIIGLEETNKLSMVSLFRWCAALAPTLESGVDYLVEADRRSCVLTEAGCRKVLLTRKPDWLNTIDSERLYKHVESALISLVWYRKDRDYVIHDGEVVIVDESTGRIMEGRKWQDGLHQSIEAKEHLDITEKTGMAAQVTVQTFFRRYEYLAGMTGTAVPARRELRKVYRLSVVTVPTHRPCIRAGLPTRVYSTQTAKWRAVAAEIDKLHKAGRPVLVGTPSVRESLALSNLLEELNIPRQVLNALLHEQEAEIVAQAGHAGRVTIATNMAGRGTDIELDDSVRQVGGLHVIATALHSSRRIDRQLIGRCARQGDPGSYQFFLSLEDDVVNTLPIRSRERLRIRAEALGDREISRRWIRILRHAQRSRQIQDVRRRRVLLHQEKKRRETYRQMGMDPYLETAEG